MFFYPRYPTCVQYQFNGKKPHPKSKFTPEEDEKLRSIVNEIGEKDWVAVSSKMGSRNTRQCKERWFNYLSPNVKTLPWTPEEDEQLKELHKEYGSKWVKISHFFPSRTDTNIKSRWMVLQRLQKTLEKKALKIAKKNAISSGSNESNNASITLNSDAESLQSPTEPENPQMAHLSIPDNQTINPFDDSMELSPIEFITDGYFDFYEMI